MKEKEKEIEELEELIAANEIDLENLDNLLCKPELYEEPEKALKLSQEREQLQLKLDKLYNQWIILTEE